MAKIQFTAFMADARNKLNGNVFSKNRYGNYIRNKVTPVNPQTSYQQQQRQQLGNLASQWRGLTQAQRDAWGAAVTNFPRKDIFGNTQYLSANTLYVTLNKNLTNAGSSVISDPPSPVAIPEFIVNSVSAAAGAGTLTISVTPDAVPSGFVLFVKATGNVGPGKNFVKNLLRFIGTATVSSGTADIASLWIARFGSLVAGQRITVQAFLVSTDSGQAGVPSQATTIVAS